MKVCSEYYSAILLYFETRVVYSDYSSSPPPWFPPTAPGNSPHELSPMCHGGSRPYEMSQSVTMYFQSALQCIPLWISPGVWPPLGHGRAASSSSRERLNSKDQNYAITLPREDLSKNWQFFVRVEKCRPATTASRMCLSKLPFFHGLKAQVNRNIFANIIVIITIAFIINVFIKLFGRLVQGWKCGGSQWLLPMPISHH